MKAKRRQSGVTLMEMTVVIAVAAMLAALGLPAIRTFFNSLATEGSTKAMIGAALSSARAIAAERQHYAGVRFQKDLYGHQYIIFIVHDFDKTGLASGFRAVEGTQPIKLPENLGVMDSYLIEEKISLNPSWEPAGDPELTDLTTFSIIFSPSGKMVIHNVRVRNRNGIYQPDNDGPPSKVSMDDTFNSPKNIGKFAVGMFVQDDYAASGLWKESSRSSFVIYERDKFRQALGKYQPYSGYLYKLRPVYINPYTGTIIDSR